jgi:hypothetical protein
MLVGTRATVTNYLHFLQNELDFSKEISGRVSETRTCCGHPRLTADQQARRGWPGH